MLPLLLPEPGGPDAHLQSRHPGSSTSNGTIADEEVDDVSPLPSFKRHGRLSMSAKAHQEWVHKKTRRWYSVVAGAIAGAISIRCESVDRRMGIAQQMFVRYVVSLSQERHFFGLRLIDLLQRPSRFL